MKLDTAVAFKKLMLANTAKNIEIFTYEWTENVKKILNYDFFRVVRARTVKFDMIVIFKFYVRD